VRKSKAVVQIDPSDVEPTTKRLRDIRTDIIAARAYVSVVAKQPDYFLYDALEKIDVKICALIQRLEPREK
jgi:hypothetical protein